MDDQERRETQQRFREAVNMSPAQLERWLATEDSRSVGMTKGGKRADSGDAESVGHESGRRIVELLRRTKADGYSEDDLAHMKRVVSYVHRHLAQRPSKEPIESSRWRYSLMNWGHDPLGN